MSIYIGNLILTTILAIIVNRKKYNKWLSTIIVSIPMICVAGFRWKVGTDFNVYYTYFSEIPNYTLNVLLGSTYSDVIPFERGFSLIIYIIGIINKEPQFIIFVMSMLTIGIIVYSLRKYSKHFGLSIYLYITTMMYYSSFNGIRQWLASALIFFAFKYLTRREWKKYLLFIIVASTIHISALIMIPIYFIVNFKPFGKKIIITIIICIIVLMLLEPILSNLQFIVSDTRYEGYTVISENDNGVNLFRILVTGVPVILSFIYCQKLKHEKENNYLINFVLINFLVMLLASQSTLIVRFTIYFGLYNIVLYTKILDILRKEEKYLFTFLLCIFYFMYMVALLPVDSNLLPYNVFWRK